MIRQLGLGSLGRLRFADAEEVWMCPEASPTLDAVSNTNSLARTSNVGDASGRIHTSSASAKLNLPSLPNRSCHVMQTFQHNLIGIGKLCNYGCKVLFDSNAVTIFSKDKKSILIKGWRDTTGAKLWRFSL